MNLNKLLKFPFKSETQYIIEVKNWKNRKRKFENILWSLSELIW